MEHLLKELETLSDADLLQRMTSIGEPPSEEDCAHLPFFGMYADQEDMYGYLH